MPRTWRHERRLEPYTNSTLSEQRRRWFKPRIQAVTRTEILSRQETLEIAERIARIAGSSSPSPVTVLPTSPQGSLLTNSLRPNGVVQGLAIDPALTLSETGLQSSQLPQATSHLTLMSSGHSVDPMLENLRSAWGPRRTPASPGEVFGSDYQRPPLRTTGTTNIVNTTIPRRFYGRTILLRFSGPDGRAILHAARIEPDCEVAQVPLELARILGWRFMAPRTRRQIFYYMNGCVSHSSLGSRIPDFLIRGFGVHLTPDSMEPELEVDICLASTPDYTTHPDFPFIDLNQVRPHWHAPYVVISRPLLIKMMQLGFDLDDSPPTLT
ncbi:hypothetical protein CC79DRAFT_817158 [Sarocladium strictum]